MGLFDMFDSNSTMDPAQKQALQMGLLNFGAQMMQNSAPGQRYQPSFGGALSRSLPSGVEAYQQGMNQSLMQKASQAKDPTEMMSILGQINDPAVQTMILQNRLKTMTPSWKESKDAMGNPFLYNENDPSQIKPLSPGSTGTAGGSGFSEAELQGYIDGRLPITPQMARSQRGMALISAITEKDPKFDAVNYNARNKAYQSLTSGKEHDTLVRAGTAINTLDKLKDASEKIGGTDSLGPLNKPANWMYNQYLNLTNDPDLINYNNLSKTAADETAATVGGGSSALGDRETRHNNLSVNLGPAGRKAAMQAQVQEMNGKVNPIADFANQSLNANKKSFEFLTPESQKAYQDLMGEASPDATNDLTKRTARSAGIIQMKGVDDPNFKLLPKGAQFMDETGQLRIKH